PPPPPPPRRTVSRFATTPGWRPERCLFPVCRVIGVAAVSRDTAPPPVLLPPLSATHAPAPARITTTPPATGLSDRFRAGAGRLGDIRCVMPSRSCVLPSVSRPGRVGGTAAGAGRPVTAATSVANLATV